MNVTGKKITVLGLGLSGLETALFLHSRGAIVFVSEQQETALMQERKARLEDLGIACEIGMHTPEWVVDCAFVVISPGIKPRSDIYRLLHEHQIEILSEVELAARFCRGEIIAVSGTDGKTTVTTMITTVLRECGFDVVSCGNIGNPFISEIERITADTKVILEVSSFQLYHMKTFKPKVSVLLNIAPDHLDWHYNFADYVDAKTRLFYNQVASDFAILNFADEQIRKFLCRIKAKKLFFNQFPTDFDANRDAAMQIAHVYGLDKEKVAHVLRDFPGVEHRMERVASDDGITYINDSKATSLHALVWGLHAVNSAGCNDPQQHDRECDRVVLICGGKNKGLDFASVVDEVKRYVLHAVIFGEAKKHIYDSWKDHIACTLVDDLPGAVACARSVVPTDGTILFSPACASFDMFSNYQERGKKFKELVRG